MKHILKALGVAAILATNVASASSVMNFTQPAKIRGDFKSTVNSITSNSNNVEEYYMNGYKAWRVLNNSSVNAQLDAYGKVGSYTSGYQSLTTDWDYKTVQREHPGESPYQCVGFVKAASDLSDGYYGRTYLWQKGAKVSKSNLPPSGAVIATFFGKDGAPGGGDDTTYSGHTAIYVSGDSSKIYVLDLDGSDGVMKIHAIPFNGSGVHDADNYYVVNH